MPRCRKANVVRADMCLTLGVVPVELAAVFSRFGKRGADIFPHRLSRLMDGQQQVAGNAGDVFQFLKKFPAAFTGFQMLVLSDVVSKEFGHLGLKFLARHGLLHGGTVAALGGIAHLNHHATSLRWPEWSRSRSFIRALWSWDLLFPIEQSSMPAISLCS